MNERVLDYVNRIRVQRRIGEPLEELPKGRPGNELRCPIANALGGACEVSAGHAFWQVGDIPGHRYEKIRLPKFVHDFIERFDAGAYPELIEED